eukprot:TRINITY_DN15025_c0_g1_i1.p1 TRINITY_DN15025_c0_g1~~TRINITY_DN15025_c0_g1_i1.p1  ORF type:complete len:239 (+),score=44.71 TRINITY_DN15025_c0_g1_i1:406-1122(+)
MHLTEFHGRPVRLEMAESQVRICSGRPERGRDYQVLVSNLSPITQEDDLYRFFNPCGKISRLKIGGDMGFVYFAQRDEALRAVLLMDGRSLHDHVIKVSCPKLPEAEQNDPKKHSSHYSNREYSPRKSDDSWNDSRRSESQLKKSIQEPKSKESERSSESKIRESRSKKEDIKSEDLKYENKKKDSESQDHDSNRENGHVRSAHLSSSSTRDSQKNKISTEELLVDHVLKMIKQNICV